MAVDDYSTSSSTCLLNDYEGYLLEECEEEGQEQEGQSSALCTILVFGKHYFTTRNARCCYARHQKIEFAAHSAALLYGRAKLT